MSDLSPPKKRKMEASESNGTLSTVVAPAHNLLIKRLSDKARLPTRGSLLAAGYDLYRYASYIHDDIARLTRLFMR